MSFHPPIASRETVYVRFGIQGEPSHCWRGRGEKKPIAFSAGLVATVSETAETDVVNVERPVPFPP